MQRTDNAAHKVLREYFAALCSSSFDPATVANELFSKKIINEALRDETTRGTSKNDQRRALVDGVMRAGRPGTFQTFLQILHKDDGYLAEQIRDAYQRATGKTIPLENGQAATPPVVPIPSPPVVPTPPPPVVPTPPPLNVITTPTTSTLSTECTSTTTVTAQVVDNGNTSVTIQSNVGAVITKMVDDDYCMVSSDGGSSNPTYKMAGNPVHGIALIISNRSFDKGLKYNAGGEVDERNLQELFGILKYQVVFLKDLKRDQISMAFKLVSGHVNYAEIPAKHKKALEALSPDDSLIAAGHDSFVCCLMSHGDDGLVHGTDGKTFDLQNIYQYLGECEHLKGKPKMIFIQACQGSATAEHNHVEDDGCAKKTADFLLSFATFYCQKSLDGKGSWYMSTLCNTFKENYKSKDVVSMITDVRKVMEQEAKMRREEVCLQYPHLEHTLRHKVHLAVEGGWLDKSDTSQVDGLSLDPFLTSQAATNPVSVSNVDAVITDEMVGEQYYMVSSDGGASSNPAYKMAGSPVHGIALIISNLKFDKGTRLNDRAGGEVDEVNLQELFGSKYLNYKVVFLKDLKRGQINIALRLVSGHKGFSYIQLGKNDKKALEALSSADSLIAAGHDSFVCCIMSHGAEGVVHGTDGKTFDLDHIYQYLGECGHLKGKPKMVFIQACQGSAIAEHDGSEAPPPPPVEDDGHVKGLSTTKTADFLLSYAAFYGQKSFREKKKGSWYMCALCNTFKQNYKSKDVVSMITDVHNEVMKQKGEEKEGGNTCKQCPFQVLTLSHKVYFAVRKGK